MPVSKADLLGEVGGEVLLVLSPKSGSDKLLTVEPSVGFWKLVQLGENSGTIYKFL